jgi:small multidrug resistance pump
MKTVEAAASAPWLLLGLAVVLEIAGVLGLRFSAGFTQALPTVAALSAFAFALYLVSKVMKVLPVSIAYPVWAGGGTAGVALIGILLLGEELNLLKALGLVSIVAGVVVVNVVSDKTTGC